MKDLRVEQIYSSSLSQHRLEQYTTYPDRDKCYRANESFKELMKKLKKKSHR